MCLGGGGISYNKSSATNKSVQSAGEPVRVRIRMQSEGFLHYYVLDAVHRTVDGLTTISMLIDQTDAWNLLFHLWCCLPAVGVD